jgi:trk system potassium uptake protein TrkH
MRNINFKIISNLIGMLMLINSIFMVVSVIVSLIYRESIYLPLLIASIITAVVGSICYFGTKNSPKKVTKRDGYLIVAAGWIFLILSGSLPYFLSIPYLSSFTLVENNFSATNIFFETIAGYTTTGATIFDNVEALPNGLLMWRSLTQWIGGMGIIVLTIAILPLLGIGGMQLFVVEAPVISADKIHPRITDTAKRLWVVYVILTFLQILCLSLAGMEFFDAINHSLTTLSSGGFSTKNDSTSFWNEIPAIQYIIMIFMFLSGVNFVLNHFLLKGEWRKLIKNEEFRWYLGLIVSISLMIGMVILFFANPLHNSIPKASLNADGLHYGIEESIRSAFFQVISVITTTGFTSADYTSWTPFVSMIFFSLLFVGGSAGSTSGGVKIIRHVILLKNSILEFKRLIHPNAIIPVRYNRKSLTQNIVYNILAFFVMYMFIWVASSIILALINEGLNPGYEEFISAMSLSASSLGNIGTGLGNYGPTDTMASLTPISKWFCAFLMILGRLELFAIIILFTPYLWKSN